MQALLLAPGMAIALATIPATIAADAAVRPAQLPDATTRVKILQRVGGAVGGALLAVIRGRGRLPQGADQAFHTAFWWLTGSSIAALAAAMWLWLTLRQHPAMPPITESGQPGCPGEQPDENPGRGVVRLVQRCGDTEPDSTDSTDSAHNQENRR